MKKLVAKMPIFCILLILCFCTGPQLSQPTERYFDTAEATSEEIRLSILYPSIGSIRSLIELRNKGLFNIENLTVIGIFHEKERTDYQKSIEYVKENYLDWIKFHKLAGELNKESLFQKNSLTTEFEKIFKHSDGIIFFGGADIPPYIYKEKTNLMTSISTPFRHFLELSFVFHLLGGSQDKDFKGLLESESEFPVLGICLGAQSLNVGTGGTLIQDIQSEIYGKKYLEDVIAMPKENWHTNPMARLYPEEKLFSNNMHPIRLNKDGKFISEFGFKEDDFPYILSAHHQMAGNLGKDIKIIATSLDGKVVEAIEHEKYPNVLGVQFHPEFPILWDQTQTFRLTPNDQEEISLWTIMENNPPSLALHKKIWSWFCEKLKANRKP